MESLRWWEQIPFWRNLSCDSGERCCACAILQVVVATLAFGMGIGKLVFPDTPLSGCNALVPADIFRACGWYICEMAGHNHGDGGPLVAQLMVNIVIHLLLPS